MALPDVLKSMQTHVAGLPTVSTLVSTAAGWTATDPNAPTSGPRVGMVIGKNWKVPSTAIVLKRAGGRGALGVGRHETRVDVWCMAREQRDAVGLWRELHPRLCPVTGDAIVGWTASQCRVTDVRQDADPIPAEDLEVGWAVLVTPYLVYWQEAPVP